jgi:hypothetical protein
MNSQGSSTSESRRVLPFYFPGSTTAASGGEAESGQLSNSASSYMPVRPPWDEGPEARDDSATFTAQFGRCPPPPPFPATASCGFRSEAPQFSFGGGAAAIGDEPSRRPVTAPQQPAVARPFVF